MNDSFKRRMIDEIDLLEDKISKLVTFLSSESFKTIDKVQQALLKIQLSAMHTYRDCLKERLTLLDEE
jgi:hypothetical protein